MGKTDYADFPEISSEINEAADAVDSATGTMDRAVGVLKGTHIPSYNFITFTPSFIANFLVSLFLPLKTSCFIHFPSLYGGAWMACDWNSGAW